MSSITIESILQGFDYKSVEKLCGTSKQVMVYGRENCFFQAVRKTLTSRSSFVKKTFDYCVGCFDEKTKTLEGWEIKKITARLTIKCECKAALVNMVFENFKRKRNGLPFIPILFVLDRDGNKYDYATSAASITSRDEKLNGQFTHKELRRCFKLCKELENSDLKEVALVAQESFYFVRLRANQQTGQIEATQIEPFWTLPNWDELWSKRRATKSGPKPASTWRAELKKLVTEECEAKVIVNEIAHKAAAMAKKQAKIEIAPLVK